MSFFDLIYNIFDQSFTSRWSGGCGGWTKELAILHVCADIIIWIAYMGIPVMLFKFYRKRKDIPFNILLCLFGAFIISCGLSHLMGAITVFYPLYYLDFWIKAFTAVISLFTAITLWKLLSYMINFPSPLDLIREAEEREEMLKEANRELENFALVAAHDLQDPIKQNKIFLKLIQEGKYEFIESAIENNVRITNFIKSLLDFARCGAPSIKEKVELEPIILQVMQDLGLKIIEAKAAINVGDLPVITCDPIQIGRVFLNLISNSIKCRSKDRQLVININARKSSSDLWEIIYEDNGIGMSKDQMKNMFVIYKGKKNDSTGAGFGLAICKKVIEAHHGKIRAESKLGEGTKFIITLHQNLSVPIISPNN